MLNINAVIERKKAEKVIERKRQMDRRPQMCRTPGMNMCKLCKAYNTYTSTTLFTLEQVGLYLSE